MTPLVRVVALMLLVVGPAFAEAPVVVPGDNLVQDGVPAIPAAIPEAVGRYTEFRSAMFASWHPARREMLITTRFADTMQVHEVRQPAGARRQLTFFPDSVRSATWPRHRSDYFVFAKDRGGDEFSQLYRVDVAGGAITLLSDGGRSQNALGPFSHAGDRMAFGSTRRNGADRDLYVMDPRDPASTRRVVELKGGGWQVADWSPDDRTLALIEEVSITLSYLWTVDVASGEATLVTPRGGEVAAWNDAAFSADGRGLYVTCDRGSEFRRLAYLELASGALTYLSTDLPWDVETLALSPDGRTLAFVTNEDGQGVLRLLDTATRAEKPRPTLPLGIPFGLSWHANGRDLGFSLVSARSPADAYSVDTVTLEVQRWTESELGGLDPAAFTEPELVRWPTFDGRSISGFLYKPPARFRGPRPVMVDIHGGPEGQARPVFLGRTSYLVNELGVAVLLPNVRGSMGYGKTFVALDNGRLREDSVKDIGALLDWLPSRPDLDATRVMITGGSYGGYMTLAVATTYDAKIRCSRAVVGISSFVTFLERTEAYRRDLRRVEYGDERDPAMRKFLEAIAPLNNAAKITRPLFVVQGKNDPRVPYTEAEQMVATVKKNGGPVWYLLATDEGHGFAKKKNADYLFYATVAFVREHLLK